MSFISERLKKGTKLIEKSGLFGIGSGKNNSAEKVLQRSQHAREKYAQAFNCIRCGRLCAYAKFIYYDLCDSCFEDFDAQKVFGRLARFGLIPAELLEHRFYTEDENVWVQHKKQLESGEESV